jgi:predicted metal-dependent hydrolase
MTWLREPPRWRLLAMKRQWGSCSPRGTLSLNPHLVKAPASCIDYVLAHELCHLKHHDHSKNFYRTLARHVPDWREVKQRLDDMADRLLID